MTLALTTTFIAQAEAAGISLPDGVTLSTAIATTMFVVTIGDKKYTMLTKPLDTDAPQFFAGTPFDGTALTLDQARVIFDLHCHMASPHDRNRDAANIAVIKNMLENPDKFPTAWAQHPDRHDDHMTRSASSVRSQEPWPYPPVR